MSAVDDVRPRLRARAAKKKPQAEPWHVPRLEDFMAGVRVLSFDAALTNTGWLLMEITDQPRVYARGTIRPKTELTGYRGTWAKAQYLEAELSVLFDDMNDLWDELAVEAPPVGGGARTESSLIAGMLVWAHYPGRCRDIAPPHMSAVLLGDHRMRSDEKKAATREFVISMIPEAAGRDWNEHQRDAAAIGFTRLHDMRRTEPQRPVWTGQPGRAGCQCPAGQ